MATRTITNYKDGVVVGTETYETSPEQDNREAIEAQLDLAIAYFSGNYRGWSGLSAAQKDTAAKNGQRAMANLLRLVRNRFDAAD